MISIALPRNIFGVSPRTIARWQDGKATAFRYETGLEGLRLSTDRIELVALPFRGQQIWTLSIDGQSMGMRGMTTTPRDGSNLLESFGAFFFHCGLMGTAAPGPDDDHPLHGELPLANISETWLEIDQTEDQAYTTTLRGRFEFARAFRAHYLAEPFVKMVSGSSDISIGISITNLSGSPMPFMYLGHPNFRTVDGGKLSYTAHYSKETVRVRQSIPAHLTPNPEYVDFLGRLAEDPVEHHTLANGQPYYPEVVFEVDYLADGNGWAHSLQVHPDGTSDRISHRPDQCPRAVRWISRNADQDAIAIAEPSTSWISGYSSEKVLGNVPELAPHGSWETEFIVGRLNVDDTRAMRSSIDEVAGRVPDRT